MLNATFDDLTQLEQLFDNAPGLVLVLAGPEHVVRYANPAYLRFIGQRELIGLPYREALSDIASQGYADLLDAVFSSTQPFIGQGMATTVQRSGEAVDTRYFDFVYQPMVEPDGRVIGIVGQSSDVTDRVAAEQRARASEQRLRATYEHAFVGIAEVDLDGRFTEVNEEFCRIAGRSREEMLCSAIWDVTRPEDQPRERDLFQRQIAGELETYTLEKSFLRPNGELAWAELRASRVDGADGRAAYGVRVVRDITQQKRWSAQQQLLVHELNHRVKNSLATVQSIVAQSLRNAGILDNVREIIEERILGLSRAHDVLTAQHWQGADVSELAAEVAAPYATAKPEALRILGRRVRVPPRVALALAMALQELATNARKYGAWSTDLGCVQLAWEIVPSTDGQRLSLAWTESGGPPVSAPARSGFGSRLLERLGADLGGEANLEFLPSGVVCTIEAEMKSIGAASWSMAPEWGEGD
jgi:PAS domain S-box-containing protein